MSEENLSVKELYKEFRMARKAYFDGYAPKRKATELAKKVNEKIQALGNYGHNKYYWQHRECYSWITRHS